MTKLILKLSVIFGIQGVLAWFFYRCRVISHESWAGSDFVVFVFAVACWICSCDLRSVLQLPSEAHRCHTWIVSGRRGCCVLCRHGDSIQFVWNVGLTMRCSEPGHRALVAIVASRGPGR
jgi:hypothetical protein